VRFVVTCLLVCSWAGSAAAQTAPEPPAPAEQPEEGVGEDWEIGVPHQLDVGAWLGLDNRLDEPPLFPSTRDQGILAGLGLDLYFSPHVSLGLHYEHVELGAEASGLTPTGTVHIARRLDALWLGARMYPIQLDGFGAFLGLGVGLAWQAAALGGSVWAAEDPGSPVALRCTGHGSANVALRAELGVDANMSESVRFVGGLGFESYRLSDGLLSDCVPGAGTAAALGLRTGLVYGIGL
jgi:opacity protein-like surface antigen